MNKFWCDFGSHLLSGKKIPFLTANVAQPTSCFAEVCFLYSETHAKVCFISCIDDFGFGSFGFTIQC